MSIRHGGALFCLFATLICACSGYAQTASNPILHHADPFISFHPVNGNYLLLASTNRDIFIWSGPTVPTVSEEHLVFRTPEDMREVWSPTLWAIGDHWWIYFTAREAGREHAIYALESDTSDPLGSYSLRGELNLGRPAIDPSLLRVNGAAYLMFVTVDRGRNEIHAIRMASPTQTLGKEALLAKPKYPWEKGAGTTSSSGIVEGPTALSHAGKTFIVYSGSDTNTPVYCLGMLTYKGGDPLKRRSWDRSARPVFSASPVSGIYGPGRGTFAEGAGGEYWLLYAAKSEPNAPPRGRAIRAQRFTWRTDGTPDFGVPEKDGPIEAVQPNGPA